MVLKSSVPSLIVLIKLFSCRLASIGVISLALKGHLTSIIPQVFFPRGHNKHGQGWQLSKDPQGL